MLLRLIWASVFLLSFGVSATACSQQGSEKAKQKPSVEKSANPTPEQPGVKLVRVHPSVTLQLPVWLTQDPASPKVWFALEQHGKIARFVEGFKKTTALDITDRVKSGGERGLLGLAFHPKFGKKSPYVYVNYTTTALKKLETRVSRFTTKDGGKTFDPDSEKILLHFDQPYSNHNGGQILFGPDGMLYIAVGDGGSGGDPEKYGQNKNSWLGSILRIDVKGEPYSIPADNPFAKKGGKKEIYAYGLRNPWRFSFDRVSGDLWAGDVGQNAWEEIDIIKRGGNYGWNLFEGRHCFAKKCPKEGLVFPVIEYSQKKGDRSVTGGYVYRGTKVPALVGKYIFGDFVSGRIWAWDIKKKERELLLDTDFNISTFVEDKSGELSIVDYGSGTVHQLVLSK